jgi:hypothetical protein
MKLTITPVITAPQKWPRLMRDGITGTIFLVPSLATGTEAIDLDSGHLVQVDKMLQDLQELPAGYSVTLTNE